MLLRFGLSEHSFRILNVFLFKFLSSLLYHGLVFCPYLYNFHWYLLLCNLYNFGCKYGIVLADILITKETRLFNSLLIAL